MPNWCNNSLIINCKNSDEQRIVDSLFDASATNRVCELTYKLRKILLAGLSGVLCPSKSVDEALLEKLSNLHPLFLTDKRIDCESSQAYDEFLELMASGHIYHTTYEAIDSVYRRTGLDNLWWGDICTKKRKKMKSLWKKCGFDYATKGYKQALDEWFVCSGLALHPTPEHCIDLRILTPLPIDVMVNGFNGSLLNCGRTYNFYIDKLGTKWPGIEIELAHTNQYIFSTAWSPVTPIIELIPEYVAGLLGKNEDALTLSCDLYFYEPGAAFQGINDTFGELSFIYDEVTDEYHDELWDEIEEAFAVDY